MCRRKTKLGITGGIGSGKSYVCRLLAERGVPVFDCDDNARAEMFENTALQAELSSLIGDALLRSDGRLNKPAIRRFLHSSEDNAARFDGAVHPCVRRRWQRWAEAQNADVVVMECALLYEAAFDSEVDFTVLVTAPEPVRIERVMQRDGIDADTVRRWISMQMSDAEKARRAHFTICNDGTTDLSSRLDELFEAVRTRE